MNTNIVNSLTLLLLIFSTHAISNENRIKNIVEFTKFTDKRDLMAILTELETEKIVLQTSISEHALKCQSVLDSCKSKFQQPGCDITHDIKKKELEATIKVTERAIVENKEILDDIAKLLENTEKDCSEIEHFYHTSKEKLNKDNKIIRGIQRQVRRKLKEVRQEKKIKDSEKKRLQAQNHALNITISNKTNNQSSSNKTHATTNTTNIRNSSVKVTRKVNSSAPNSSSKKKNVTSKTAKPITKSSPLDKKSQSNGNTSQNHNQTKANNSQISNNITNNKTNLTNLKSKFIDLEEEEEDKGFLTNLFEKITGMFSLIQIKSVDYQNLEAFSFTQIQSKLEKMLSLSQKLNFLITTLHEFEIISKSIRESKHDLKKSYSSSQRNCAKRTIEYRNKRKYSEDMYVESKVNLEIYKKKLAIEESKLTLCSIRSSDLILCNEMNAYCGKYQQEYKSEEKELEDLIMFFKTYIEKYN